MSMQAPALDDYTRVRQGQVQVEYASADSNGDPGEFASVGCLEGDFTVNRGVETIEDDITNWCTVGVSEFLASAQPGEQTVTLDGTLVMLLGDEGYVQVKGDANAKREGFWRITAENGEGDEQIETFRAFFTQWNETYRQEGVSVVAFSARVVELITES